MGRRSLAGRQKTAGETPRRSPGPRIQGERRGYPGGFHLAPRCVGGEDLVEGWVGDQLMRASMTRATVWLISVKPIFRGL